LRVAGRFTTRKLARLQTHHYNSSMHKHARLTAVYPLILTLLLFAFGLRFHKLNNQSFWNDEGNSARLSERTLDKIIEGTASDVHPPLYYLALRGWRELVGDSEFGLRSFSAFAGFLTVVMAVAWTRPFSTPLHRWATVGLLTAVSPPLIYYSQETRMYALLGLLAIASSWLLLRWLGQPHRWPLAMAYVLLITAGLYTHYFFPAVIVAHNFIVLWAIVRPDRFASTARRLSVRSIVQWTGMMVAAFILYLPWLPIALKQLGRDGTRGNYGQITAVFRWLLLGSTSGDGWLSTIALIAALLLLALGYRHRDRLQLLILFLVPVAFVFLLGTTEPQFFKFLVTAVTPFLLLLGLGWEKRRSIFQPILLMIVLAATAVSLDNLYNNPAYARADYRAIAASIAADAHPNAGIILNAPNQWEVFTYYWHPDDALGGAPVYPLPPGTSSPTTASVDAALTTILAEHDRLYAIFWGDIQRDPERLVERWLDEHAFKATEEWVGDVCVVMYAVPTEITGVMQTAAQTTGAAVPFGDNITLDGYTIAPERPFAGDVMQLTLFWKTAVSLDTRYKVFIHLLDSDGNIVAQRDSEPGGNLIPTDGWQAGKQIVDNHGLLIPADAPAGTYTIMMGLYEVGGENGRLPIQINGEVMDALPVGEIELR